jgi:hypothetical protein
LDKTVKLDFPAANVDGGLGVRLRRAKRRKANESEGSNY